MRPHQIHDRGHCLDRQAPLAPSASHPTDLRNIYQIMGSRPKRYQNPFANLRNTEPQRTPQEEPVQEKPEVGSFGFNLDPEPEGVLLMTDGERVTSKKFEKGPNGFIAVRFSHLIFETKLPNTLLLDNGTIAKQQDKVSKRPAAAIGKQQKKVLKRPAAAAALEEKQGEEQAGEEEKGMQEEQEDVDGQELTGEDEEALKDGCNGKQQVSDVNVSAERHQVS